MGHLLERYLEMEFSDDQIKGYLHHFAYFTIFSLLLTIFNTQLVDIQSPWWLWIVFFWGIAVLVHFFLIIKNAQKRHLQKTMSRDGGSEVEVSEEEKIDTLPSEETPSDEAPTDEAPTDEERKDADNAQKNRTKPSREKNS
ncbi:MAG: 2TM domain-containing protein [Spirochaetia bacterium]|nr:2TM domain-containing protein [Spirochaetia bacterium]